MKNSLFFVVRDASFFGFLLLIFAAVCLAILFFIIKKHKESDYYRQTGKSIIDLYNDKGSAAEFVLSKHLDIVSGYKKMIFNCYIPKNDSTTTEIDVIMIHEKGIYVFESKNYSGWIFGSEEQPKWTQSFRKGRYGSQKFHFYNPIMQNKTHIKWLKNYLQPLNLQIPFYSCIVFGNSCELKDVTLTSNRHVVLNEFELHDFVQNHLDSSCCILTEYQVDEIYDRLFPLTQVSEFEKIKHVYDVSVKMEQKTAYQNNVYSEQNLNSSNNYSKESLDSNEKRCPRCGSDLILRTSKKGDNAGQKFWGCKSYPKCRYTEKL